MIKSFEKLSDKTSRLIAHPFSFIIVIVLLLCWLKKAFFLEYNLGYALLGDVLTICLLFLLQRSNNKSIDALQLKIDVLLDGLRPSEKVNTQKETDESLQERIKDIEEGKPYERSNRKNN